MVKGLWVVGIGVVVYFSFFRKTSTTEKTAGSGFKRIDKDDDRRFKPY